MTVVLFFQRINGERSSPESDIYSVGIIMSEMLSREEPFSNFKGFQAMQHVQGGGVRHIKRTKQFVMYFYLYTAAEYSFWS